MSISSMEPRSRFILVGDLRLHINEWGDAGAPAVVLLHGMRDHGRSWDWVAHALSSEYRVIAPDLRGHGDSDPACAAGYSIAAFILDLADIVDALALDRFALVGHSLGGAVALRYAGVFPERATAYCGIESIELPVVRDERRSPTPAPVRLQRWIIAERERRIRTPRHYPTIAAAQQRLAEEQPTLDTSTVAHLARHALIADGGGGWRWKFDNAARHRAPEDADGRALDQVLAAITCPSLLCYGGRSWIPVPPADRLTLLRDHRVQLFPDASHWLQHEARDKFIAALKSFLDPITESRPHA